MPKELSWEALGGQVRVPLSAWPKWVCWALSPRWHCREATRTWAGCVATRESEGAPLGPLVQTRAPSWEDRAGTWHNSYPRVWDNT